MDEVMYPKDFKEEKDDNDEAGDDSEEEGVKKKSNCSNKPQNQERLWALMGPYYRVTSYFLQELHPFMLCLGLNPTAV